MLVLAVAGSLSAPVHAEDFRYVVRQGDNPWNLTERYLHDFSYWPRLMQYNRIADPQAMQPGSALRIPAAWLRLQSAEVRIGELRGQVQVLSAGKDAAAPADWESARADQRLTAGQRLRTAADASVTLELTGGTVVLVRPDTELRLVQAQQPRVPDGGVWLRIELLRGGLENIVRRRAGGGTRFEIETPSAVAAVRGTEFRVSAVADAARTEVLEGAVSFSSQRAAVNLPAGTGSVAAVGQAPQAAVTLLPPPDLSGLPTRIRRLPINIAVPPVAGAVRYQSQFSPVGSALIASDEASATPHARARDLPDGDYRLRVRGVDALGLEGRHAERLVTIDARPEPPVLSSPAPEATLPVADLSFRWTDAKASSYHLQLAASADFAQPLFDQIVTDRGITLPAATLAAGVYHWRVASRTAEGKQGPYSDVERLRLVPQAPAVEPASQEGDSLRLRWRAGEPGVSYRFQLARDDRFADVVVDQRVETPSVALDALPPGTYRLRVQTLTPDGFEGPWSAPQQVDVEAPPRNWWPLLLLTPLLILL